MRAQHRQTRFLLHRRLRFFNTIEFLVGTDKCICLILKVIISLGLPS